MKSATEKMVGVVQDWDRLRNFGWIASDRPLGRFFVHRDDVRDRIHLKVGQRVTFTPAKAPRGPRAVGVELEPGSVAAEEVG